MKRLTISKCDSEMIMMHHPRFTRQSMVLSAALVALSYVALVVLAAACAFGHADTIGDHAHHGSSEAAPHNALCAWACQATSDAVVSLASSMASTELIAQHIALPPHQLAPSPSSARLHSRAPPSISFACIG